MQARGPGEEPHRLNLEHSLLNVVIDSTDSKPDMESIKWYLRGSQPKIEPGLGLRPSEDPGI